MLGGIFEFLTFSIAVGGISAYIAEYVNSDSVSRLLSLLPGLDCGSCKKENCREYAEAILKGEKGIHPCYPIIGREEFDIINREFSPVYREYEEKVAHILCGASVGQCEYISEVSGFSDCMSAYLNNAKVRGCDVACLMLGSCAKVCPNGAIDRKKGAYRVDVALCAGCGLCVSECPIDIITLIPKKSEYVVSCTNDDIGANVHKYCTIGCLGCDVCSKVCTEGAIVKRGSIVYIEQTKCNNCGICALKCPTGIISVLGREPKFAEIDGELCDNCGVCVEECPVNCIKQDEEGNYFIDSAFCNGCGRCIDKCPRYAIDERKDE